MYGKVAIVKSMIQNIKKVLDINANVEKLA